MGFAIGQRVRKQQPDGGSIALGGSPASGRRSRFRSASDIELTGAAAALAFRSAKGVATGDTEDLGTTGETDADVEATVERLTDELAAEAAMPRGFVKSFAEAGDGRGKFTTVAGAAAGAGVLDTPPFMLLEPKPRGTLALKLVVCALAATWAAGGTVGDPEVLLRGEKGPAGVVRGDTTS